MSTRHVLESLGCILEGNFFFALKSGKVATTYVNIDPLLTKPTLLEKIADELIDRFPQRLVRDVQVVAGPAVGAIPISYFVASRLLRRGLSNPDVVFAEKDGDSFRLDRLGFDSTVRGKNVLLVEDIVTTGGSLKKTADCIHDAAGNIMGAVAIWQRARTDIIKVQMPIFPIINEEIPVFTPEDHPHWGEWPLVSDIGHPSKFQDYPGERIELIS